MKQAHNNWHTCNSSHGIAPHSSLEIAATCIRIDEYGPRFCRINSTVVNRNVTIETRSRRRHVLASDGSDGDDIFVSPSSYTSLATSTVFNLPVLLSDVNGFNLNSIGLNLLKDSFIKSFKN